MPGHMFIVCIVFLGMCFYIENPKDAENPVSDVFQTFQGDSDHKRTTENSTGSGILARVSAYTDAIFPFPIYWQSLKAHRTSGFTVH